jgi:hypothetical protein
MQCPHRQQGKRYFPWPRLLHRAALPRIAGSARGDFRRDKARAPCYTRGLMKRLLLVLLALVPGLVLLAWLGSRGDRAVGRWQRLPSGGEVRVRGVTFGTEHEMENDDRSLQQRVRDWWKGPRPKRGPSPFALRKVTLHREHSLHLWVEQRNMPDKNLRIPYAALRLPEGDIFPDTKKST